MVVVPFCFVSLGVHDPVDGLYVDNCCPFPHRHLHMQPLRRVVEVVREGICCLCLGQRRSPCWDAHFDNDGHTSRRGIPFPTTFRRKRAPPEHLPAPLPKETRQRVGAQNAAGIKVHSCVHLTAIGLERSVLNLVLQGVPRDWQGTLHPVHRLATATAGAATGHARVQAAAVRGI